MPSFKRVKNIEKYKIKKIKDTQRADLFSRINLASVSSCINKIDLVVNKTQKNNNKCNTSKKCIKKYPTTCKKKSNTIKCQKDISAGQMLFAKTMTKYISPVCLRYESENNKKQPHDNAIHRETETPSTSCINEKYSGFCFSRTKEVDQFRKTLLITYQESEIISAIRENQVVLITGSTGCGKSTQVPQMLLENGFTKIVMTQPRRISCTEISKRINYEINDELAAYRFRFRNNITAKTEIQIVTDGILLKEIIHDDRLLNFNIIIIDEFHELTANIIIILHLIQKLSNTRPDIRIVLMSATPDKNIKNFPINYKQITIHSRTHTIVTHYHNFDLDHCFCQKCHGFVADSKSGSLIFKLGLCFHGISYMNRIIRKIVLQLILEKSGNILVFLVSKSQIYSLIDSIQRENVNIDLIPFHASINTKNEESIHNNRRKCIFATNYAETGLTISGIKYVIDCGFQKICIKNDVFCSYHIVPISNLSAEQRRGRAGRTENGVCHRIYTPVFHKYIYDNDHAIANHKNLDFCLLALFYFGIHLDIFMRLFDHYMLKNSRKTLKKLGAIKNNKITERGKLLISYPFEPKLSYLLLTYNCNEMKLVVSIMDSALEVSRCDFDVFYEEEVSDLFAKVNIILFYRKLAKSNKYKQNITIINGKDAAYSSEDIKRCSFKGRTIEYNSTMIKNIDEILQYDNMWDTQFDFNHKIKLTITKYIFVVYHDHLCEKIDGFYYYKGQKVYIDANSKTTDSKYFVFQHLIVSNNNLYASNITEIDESWLLDENKEN